MKEKKIGNNTSPGTDIKRSMYNSIKYRNKNKSKPYEILTICRISLRDTLKDKPDQEVNQLFGTSNQDFIENFKMDKNNSKKKIKKNPRLIEWKQRYSDYHELFFFLFFTQASLFD